MKKNNTQINVANIIEEGKLGGPQVRICSVARALKGSVNTTVIMPIENSDTFQQKCILYNVPYKAFTITRITKEWRVAIRYILFSLFEISRLARFLEKGKYDLVHVSGGSWQFKGVIAARLAGKKVVWHLNDTYMPKVIKRIFSILSQFADGFIFASERSRNYYASMVRNDKPYFVIPAPVDAIAFDPEREYFDEKEVFGHWVGKKIIGTIANVNRIKGLDVLIRSAMHLNKQGFNVQFVVVGEIFPSQQAYYMELCKLATELGVENVEFVGARNDVRPFLNRFDVYLCSSNAESSPLSVWEAMAMAKPIVSTDVGDVPLYVKDNESGFIVDVGDSTAIAERLVTLLENEELRNDFGKKARDVAARELDLTRCAERHLNAYQKILSL